MHQQLLYGSQDGLSSPTAHTPISTNPTAHVLGRGTRYPHPTAASTDSQLLDQARCPQVVQSSRSGGETGTEPKLSPQLVAEKTVQHSVPWELVTTPVDLARAGAFWSAWKDSGTEQLLQMGVACWGEPGKSAF